MNKSFIKEINLIIKNMDNTDYISKVKYVIFFVCKILYICKLNSFDILNNNFSSFKSKYVSNEDNMGIFVEYKIFNLNYSFSEEKIYELISANKDIFLEKFQPAALYEILLTTKEKKSLGQVYTPIKIIDEMLTQIFTIKTIDRNTTILDPSCGGGYFLIESFVKIKNLCLENVDDKYILEHMLYGIDIDDFSIFLTKMGLLFSCQCSKVNFNVFNIDFLIDSFDLNNVNNFDIIIGNPPYIGHKNSSAKYKKALYEKYSDVFYDKADISYCFFKKSKDLLSPNGIVSFITSRYFMEALFADRLRLFLINNFYIVSLLDYSGINIFKDVMVSSAVITLSNIAGNKNEFSYVKYTEDNCFIEKFNFSQDKLKNTGWIILNDVDEQLFNKIESISNTYIKDVCTIKQGIITGLDKAFIVDEETIEKYKIESFLLRKWIKNSNIRESGVKYNNLYLIYSNNIENELSCPNAIKYLSTYHEKLMERRECIKGYRKWYELQWGRIQSDFENPKIVFPYKSKGNNFYYDTNEYFCSADVYIINDFHKNILPDYMLSYLNSNIFEFYFKCQAKKVGNNIYEYYPNKLNNVKIYLPPKNKQQNMSDLGKISIELFLKKVFNINDEEVNNIINKYIQKRWWRILKRFSKLLFFITIFIVLSIQTVFARSVYYDTYNHWAESDINFASNSLQVFKGYGDFTFKPENNITRAEFITILARTAYRQNKMNEVYTSDMSYSDMSNKHWSYTFIISMYKHLESSNSYSLKDVFPGTYFYPDKAITREESAALIAAFCKDSIYDNPLSLSDVSSSNKYYNEIRRLNNAGIVVGYENKTFQGNTNITRAESAALIKRVYLDIKTSDASKYLTKLEFMPIKGEDMYSYFGKYDLSTTNVNDKKFIKAKDTLEYVTFGGSIFPEDSHLYDLNAVATMATLRSSGYYNVAGTNFYMITFGSYNDSEKTQFANEILANIIARDDFKDSELMQIFATVSKYNVKENLYIGALEKWDNITISDNAKANILFYRYTFYIKTNNKEMLKTLVFDDLKKANSIASLLDINWGLTAGSGSIDFRNYSFGNYSFSLYKDTTFYRYSLTPPLSFDYNSKVVELVNMLLIEKSVKPTTTNLTNFESIFNKYSLNRLYVLNFIGEKERAFVEGLNDYEIIKTFKMYNTNKIQLDDTYTGVLKKVKE